MVHLLLNFVLGKSEWFPLPSGIKIQWAGTSHIGFVLLSRSLNPGIDLGKWLGWPESGRAG